MRTSVLPVLIASFCAACAGSHGALAPGRPSAATAPAEAAPAPAPSFPPPTLRLPPGIRPVMERVTLALVPAENEFQGEATLELTVDKESPILWLNATELTVEAAAFSRSGTEEPARVVKGGEDFLGFVPSRPLAPGPVTLTVRYRGKVTDTSDRGVFRERQAPPGAPKSEELPYLFSQFENTEARRAFPCFDEPSFKHPWEVTLKVKAGDTAFSNTPVASEGEEGGWQVVRFARTRPLPAYLVAFAVGPFETVEAGKVGSAPIRIVVPRGWKGAAGYAVEETAPVLTLLEQQYGIPYPYPKLDVVAIPHLLTFGAMENAGMITCGQTIMLASPGEASLDFKRGYTATIAHEMAHQWFGDLVTTAWWDDIWLNEAFATWMGTKVSEARRPDWDFEIELHEAVSRAMDDDTLLSSRKIRQPIETADDIEDAFDAITYDKGAAVLGMFEGFAGPEKFRAGVKRYLLAHADGTATARDFVHSISEEAGTDLEPAFFSFLDQAGVPLLTASLACEQGRATATVSQKRLLPPGSAGEATPTRWRVPVCMRYGAAGSTGRTCALLEQETASLSLPPLPGGACPSWLLPDEEGRGYYRVGFTAKTAGQLLDRKVRLDRLERLAVTDDAAADTWVGLLTEGEALDLARKAVSWEDPVVLRAAVGLASIRAEVVPASREGAYQRYIREVFGKQARALGWISREADTPQRKILRDHLLPFVADRGEDPALVEEAKKLASRWLDDPHSLPEESVDRVLGSAAQHADRAWYERVVAAFRKTTDPREQRHLIQALDSVRNPEWAAESASLILDPSLDLRATLFTLLGDYRTREARLQFVRGHMEELKTRIPPPVARYLIAGVGETCDPTAKAEVEATFRPQVGWILGGPRALAQVLEATDLCIARRPRVERELEAALPGAKSQL